VRDWRLIETWGASPSFNMGLDEALLLDEHAPPTLRLYTWEPDTLSLGYFQRWVDVPGTAVAGAVVRRLTGGGAIHHTGELTFSLTTSAQDPIYRGPVADSYERVHGAIAAALREFGAEAALAGGEGLASDAEDTGMCFHKSTPLDLAWGGRKGVGSAQRRTRGRVLHHGSIKLASSELEGPIATLEASSGRALDPRAVGAALTAVLASRFELDFDAQQATSAERAAAAELGPRYSDPAFLRRR
jgi:lipoyl(octanoyl) transferase